jgi:chorismate mutase
MDERGAAEARLEAIRSEIDAIDDRLLALVASRAELGIRAGDAKAALGRPVHDAARERAVVDRIVAAGAGPISDEDLRALWELLLAATRRAEERRAR